MQVLAEESESFPITLVVGGAVIAGELVSERAYFDSGSLPKNLRNEILRMLEKAREKGPPNYVHLKNVRLLLTNGAVGKLAVAEESAAHRGLLRVRLSSVDAWLPGAIDATPR